MRIQNSLWVLVVVSALCWSCATAPANNDVAESESPQAQTKDAEKSAEPAEPRKNALKWTTASEVENFGFDIYRALAEEGPFTRMTKVPLPGAGTTDEPQSYEWYDYDIEPKVAYFYYIESISMGGVREKFSPIIKAPPKD